ncbi:MAG: glycosyltransferase [Candidatus Thermoplasmatota archaeon]|nr:glycosyltransferase [Candidatus Thermoplasmatota archaeon]
MVKGTFEQFGGAERDLLNNLEAWQAHFEITCASLHLTLEARERMDSLGILYLTPAIPWNKPIGKWAEFRAIASRQASNRWWRMLELTEQGLRLHDVLATSDMVHLTSGIGSLEFSQLLPKDLPVHYHCLEPHRGLHEDVLHRTLNGTAKQNLLLTSFLLGKQRRRDLSMTHDLADRPNSIISGNSPWIQQRIETVYGEKSELLWPSVNLDVWSGENPEPENCVVAIGNASYVKGTMDTIDMLAGTGLSYHHVGGGMDEDIATLKAYASDNGVELIVEPRLSQEDLVNLVKRSLAVVSLARGEPFGLTPIEAQAAGTPALMVDEGGYQHTIEDGVSGRLLPRGEWASWHSALKEAKDASIRKSWANAGQENIAKMGLRPQDQADALKEIYSKLLEFKALDD